MHEPVNEFKYIKEVSQSARTTPPPELWNEITERLDTKAIERNNAIKKRFGLLGRIAATALLLACCLYVFQESNKATEMGIGHIAGWEELNMESDHLYDTKKLHTLYHAYVSSGQ